MNGSVSELSLSRHDHFFRPCRGSAVLTAYPQLALWAAFFRRFATERVAVPRGVLALVKLSKSGHYPADNAL